MVKIAQILTKTDLTDILHQYRKTKSKSLKNQLSSSYSQNESCLVQWREITVKEVESVPEPASLVALLGFGALGLATRRKVK